MDSMHIEESRAGCQVSHQRYVRADKSGHCACMCLCMHTRYAIC